MIAAGLLASAAIIDTAHPRVAEAAPAPALIAGCDGPREGSASGPGAHRFAQTFVPKGGGLLTSAQLDVTKAPGTSGDWIIEVALNERIPIGAPARAVVASARIPDATVPTGPSTITASFADSATIGAAGSPRQEYELAVTRPGATDITVGHRRGNDCAGLLFRSSSQTGPFAPFGDGTADMVFKLFASDVAPPQTRIVKRPRKRTTRRRARFRWRANEAVAGYRCRLDRRRLKPCDPPKKVKVGRGWHTFRARAIDLAGNVDPTPAKFRWKVLRRRR